MVFSDNWNDVYPRSLDCGDGPAGTSCSYIGGYWGKKRTGNPRVVDREGMAGGYGPWYSRNHSTGGNAPKEIQRHLNDFIQHMLERYEQDTPSFLTMDGILGTASDTAIKYFQRKHALTQDGIVGLATWTHLRDVPPVL